jgi:hypothetical protein
MSVSGDSRKGKNMKRGEMLYCADVEAPRYTVLKQRGQLPFFVADPDGRPMGNKYTLEHAWQLRMTADLIGGEALDDRYLQGLGPDYASSTIVGATGYFPVHPLCQFTPFDWWAGVVVFEDEILKADKARPFERSRWSAWYAGELSAFPAWVAEKAQRENEKDGVSRVVRMFLANATRAADFVRDRAQERGLLEGSFDHPYDKPAGA